MKKLLLTFTLFSFGVMSSQTTVYSYGFTPGTPATLTTTDGWSVTNQSTAAAATVLWATASYTPPTSSSLFGSTSPQGQAGGLNSFALVNYTSTTQSSSTGATISNWLISPNVTVENGDIVSFWSRKGTDGTIDYPDRLELRMSSVATTVVPSAGPTDVGSFTTLGVSVNPNLLAGFVYPKVWTQYSFTVSGLSGPTVVKFAFRYFVTDGGPLGNNSDLIGIDTFNVQRPAMGTNDFLSSNIVVYPNPAKNEINISNSIGAIVNSMNLTDLNGRVVKSQELNTQECRININDLASGIYLMNITTDLGLVTKKIIKD